MPRTPNRAPSEAVGLETTLTADVGTAAVEFTLAVTNTGTAPVTLEFRSGRVAEFVVAADAVAWRSSHGQFVTQARWSEQLDPGETLTETATWDEPLPGSYTARATLEATNVDVSAEASFSR